MEDKLEQAYLYDFYGELLSDRQRKIYEDVIFHDLSLGEIAQEEGISRQGVHETVKRCREALEGYECRLHLVQKFLATKGRVAEIHALTREFKNSHDESVLERIGQISNMILEEL